MYEDECSLPTKERKLVNLCLLQARRSIALCWKNTNRPTIGLWLKNISGYICNHGSPSGERDTPSPRGRYGERRQRDPCLKHTYTKTPLVGWRKPMTSLPARPQYKGRQENTSFASSSEACIRSMAHSLGDAVSRSPIGEPCLHM